MFIFVILNYSLEGPPASKTRILHDRSHHFFNDSLSKNVLTPMTSAYAQKIEFRLKNSLKKGQIGRFTKFLRPQVCTFEVVQN